MDNPNKITVAQATGFSEAAQADRPGDDQSARYRSELLSLVAHEIGAPVESLLETLPRLLETELSGDQRHYVEKMHQSGIALLTVMNDILDLEKIEDGRMHLEAVDFDLHAMVPEVVRRLRAARPTEVVELTCLIHQDVPAGARGDAGRLQQVLTNFLSNVVRLTTPKEIILRVKVGKDSGDAVTIRFEASEADPAVDIERPDAAMESSSKESIRRRAHGATHRAWLSNLQTSR